MLYFSLAIVQDIELIVQVALFGVVNGSDLRVCCHLENHSVLRVKMVWLETFDFWKFSPESHMSQRYSYDHR